MQRRGTEMVGERERERKKKRRRNGQAERERERERSGWMTSSLLSSRWRGVDKVSPRFAIGGQDQAGCRCYFLLWGAGASLSRHPRPLPPLRCLNLLPLVALFALFIPFRLPAPLSSISSRSAEALPASSETINSPSSPDCDIPGGDDNVRSPCRKFRSA